MQVVVALVGDVVGVVLVQPLKDKAGGVNATLFTVRLMATEAAVPILGVATKLPV